MVLSLWIGGGHGRAFESNVFRFFKRIIRLFLYNTCPGADDWELLYDYMLLFWGYASVHRFSYYLLLLLFILLYTYFTWHFFISIFPITLKNITSCQYCEFWGAFHHHRRIFSSQTTAVALKMFINDFPFMESMPSNNNNFVLKSEPFSEGIYNGNVWITGNNWDNVVQTLYNTTRDL